MMAQGILREILDQYLKLDRKTLGGTGGVDELLRQKVVEIKGKLTHLDGEIKAARARSGVSFPEETTKVINEQIAKSHSDIDAATAELEEKKVMFTNMVAALGTNSPLAKINPTNNVAKEGTNSSLASAIVQTNSAVTTNAVAASAVDKGPTTNEVASVPPDKSSTNIVVKPGEPPTEVVEDYQHIRTTIIDLYKERERLLMTYQPNSSPIVLIKKQLDPWEAERKKMEAEYPKLATMPLPGIKSPIQHTNAPTQVHATGAHEGTFDPITEQAKIKGMERKVEFLQTVLLRQLATATNIAASVQDIEELKSQRKSAEEEYKKYDEAENQLSVESKVAQTQVAPVIENPTPALPDKKQTMKIVGGLAFAGFFVGLGWAFLVELFLDRSLKRPKDVELKLGLPLLLSFPNVGKKGILGALTNGSQARLLNNGNGSPVPNGADPMRAAGDQIALWDHSHSLHTYYEALRDRLIGYFEVRNLTHKPKLVAVTGAGRGAGTSTIAMGLAASLSETGEGNVLLVDMNLQNGAAHQFFKGQPACGLDEALVDGTRDTGFVHKNLYVANGASNAEKLPRILPKRFSSLLPKLKASDYDYIIFDMPPVSQTSITPRLAGFMDMVLMVVESEKTDRDAAQRALAMLADSKANVSAVLNKTRKYVPSRLLQEN